MITKSLKLSPRHFEIASYLAWGATASLIAARRKNRREYMYALFGCSLLFPFEWFADNHLIFMKFSEEFAPLISPSFLPRFIFFAYGWFFATPLIANLQLEEKLDALPLRKQLQLLYAAYIAWDFLVEYTSTAQGLWTYGSNVKKIGGLPWHVPFGVAAVNTGLYYAHKAARKRSSGKSWVGGLAVHAAAYWSLLIPVAMVAWVIVKIRGHHPV